MPSPADESVIVFDHRTRMYKPSEVTVDDIDGAAGAGGVYPPPPTEPNARNDEFDGTSTAVWSPTPIPALEAESLSRPGHLRLKASGSANKYVGLLQPVPTTFPFTVETKLVSSTIRAGSHRTGLLFSEGLGQFSTMAMVGLLVNTSAIGTWFAAAWNGSLSGGGHNVITTQYPSIPRDLYLRVRVNSLNSLDIEMSSDAHVWSPIATNWNPGFNMAYMGLALNEEGSNIGTESSFEYFRIS